MMAFYNKFTPKAQKSYKCFLCGETILKGERHVKEKGLWEGAFFERRSHDTCYLAISYHMENSDFDDFTECEVYDSLRNSVCYGCDKYDDCELETPRCRKVIQYLDVHYGPELLEV